MITELFNNPISFIFWLVSLVVAITIHEFAHALAAERLGDPTPRLMGRLTLNPLAHLDPLGSLMMLLVRFGWGKPVIFDPFNLRNPRRDSAIISIAGPVSNLLLATVCALLFRFAGNTSIVFAIISTLLNHLIVINVVLAIFNLVPIHPLDGFKIVGGILPEEYARQWAELEGYGMIFLIFLMFPLLGGTAPIQRLISPVINFILNLLIPSAPII